MIGKEKLYRKMGGEKGIFDLYIEDDREPFFYVEKDSSVHIYKGKNKDAKVGYIRYGKGGMFFDDRQYMITYAVYEADD